MEELRGPQRARAESRLTETVGAERGKRRPTDNRESNALVVDPARHRVADVRVECPHRLCAQDQLAIVLRQPTGIDRGRNHVAVQRADPERRDRVPVDRYLAEGQACGLHDVVELLERFLGLEGHDPEVRTDRGVPVPAVQTRRRRPSLQVDAERERRGHRGDHDRQAHEHPSHRRRGPAPPGLHRERVPTTAGAPSPARAATSPTRDE